jgi:HK97 family phage major capsid protein
MTEDERKQFLGLEAQLETTETELQMVERQAARERRATPEPDASSEAATEAARRAGVQVGRDNAEDDPKRGFKSHREFMQAVMAVGQGRREDPRLRPLKATVGSDEQGEYSDPHGGYLIPVSFSPEPRELMPEDDPTAGRTTAVPMTTPTVKFNARVDKNHSTSVSGGLVVYRRPETVEATSSRMSWEQITMQANGLFGLTYATEEILSDSPVSFIALLERGFRQQFASHLLNERLRGTGVGEFEGILNSPALITVTEEGGQSADTIEYENIKKMRARCWGYGSAIWLANHDTLPQMLSLVQTVGTGGVPIYHPSAQDGEPDRLLGRPIFYSEYPSTLGDLGDIILANWGEYLEGTLQGLQSAESIHVRFVNHERAFKFWVRNDGRGWWRSVLTPKYGATMSPFVTLSAR